MASDNPPERDVKVIMFILNNVHQRRVKFSMSRKAQSSTMPSLGPVVKMEEVSVEADKNLKSNRMFTSVAKIKGL